LNGDQPLALTQYLRCAQILRDQIGVAPTEETRALYEKMLHHRFEPARDALKPNPTPETNQPLSPDPTTENALERIHHLMQVVDKTHHELRALEELILKRGINCG
jgi:hypothetical protein